MKSLADYLRENHVFVNGCWHTQYGKIPGFKLLASTTNGTSGLAMFRGRKVYFYGDENGFTVEPA